MVVAISLDDPVHFGIYMTLYKTVRIPSKNTQHINITHMIDCSFVLNGTSLCSWWLQYLNKSVVRLELYIPICTQIKVFVNLH